MPRGEHVAGLSDRMDVVTSRTRCRQFVAQVADVHEYGSCISMAVGMPGSSVDLVLREDLIRISSQQQEEVIFLGCETDGYSVEQEISRRSAYLQSWEPEHRSRLDLSPRSTTQIGFHSCH